MCAVNAVSNNKIKEITKLHQKKYREETGLFIAEGEKILEELISEKAEIIDVFALKSFDISKYNIKATIIDEAAMKKLTTTSSVCEVLTVAKQKKHALSEAKKLNKIALFEEISDPGNLGTIIRSAAAFGIEGIVLYGNCIDLYNSKVIRSAAGNFFKTPIFEIQKTQDLKNIFNDYEFIATALSKENNISLKDCAKLDKYVIMFGSEAKGLTKDLTKIADKNIKLEMKKNVESLNLSISASVIFYELFING